MNSFNLRRNVVSTVISFGLNLVLVFVSYRLVIRHGGLEAVGLWATLRSWIFIIRLGDAGMANAVVRYAAACDPLSEPMRIRRYVDSGLAMNSALFLALSLAGWAIFTTYLSHILPKQPAAQAAALPLLPILFTSFFLENISGLVMGCLRSIHRGYVAAWISVVGTVTQLAVVVPLVPRVGLAGLAWGYFAQFALMLGVGWVLFLVYLRRGAGESGGALPINGSWSVLKEMFVYSVTSQVANLSNGIFEPLAKIMVGRLGGLEALGIFELAWRMVALPRNAIVSGVQAAVPATTRLIVSDLEATRALYRRSLRLTMTAGLGVLITVVIASPVVSWLWLERLDTRLVIFVAILATGFFVNMTGAPAFTIGVASGRLGPNIQSALISVALMMALASLGSLLGGVISITAGIAFALIFGGIYIRYRNERVLEE